MLLLSIQAPSGRFIYFTPVMLPSREPCDLFSFQKIEVRDTVAPVSWLMAYTIICFSLFCFGVIFCPVTPWLALLTVRRLLSRRLHYGHLISLCVCSMLT